MAQQAGADWKKVLAKAFLPRITLKCRSAIMYLNKEDEKKPHSKDTRDINQDKLENFETLWESRDSKLYSGDNGWITKILTSDLA